MGQGLAGALCCVKQPMHIVSIDDTLSIFFVSCTDRLLRLVVIGVLYNSRNKNQRHRERPDQTGGTNDFLLLKNHCIRASSKD